MLSVSTESARLLHHRRWLVGIAAAILVLGIIVRLRLLGMPFERDEGEYAYAGWLITKGVPPYLLAYNMKFPGVYYLYSAVIVLANASPVAIHVALLLFSLGSAGWVYCLGRRYGSLESAVVAATTAFVLMLSPSVLGLAAHATHFLVFFALAGFVALERAAATRQMLWWFVAGILLGSSVLMKQHAIFIACLGVVWPFVITEGTWRTTYRRRLRESGLVLAGFFLPLFFIALILAQGGVLGRAWHWTFDYAREYVSVTPLSQAVFLLWRQFRKIFRVWGAMWALSGIGAMALWWLCRPVAKRLLLLLLASFAAVLPGFYFRPHYFIVMLPFVALLAVLGITAICERLVRFRCPMPTTLGASLLFAVLGSCIWNQSQLLFAASAIDVLDWQYGRTPFREAPAIGRAIAGLTQPNERIAVLGSEPELMVYAERQAATGYMYMVPLLEKQAFAIRMQNELIAELAANRPEALVLIDMPGTWDGPQPTHETPTRVVAWTEVWMRQNYRPAAIFPIGQSRGKVVPITDPVRLRAAWNRFSWCIQTATHPCERNWVWVLERADHGTL